jgi:FlaA1/EpsC-like NDP-sugar epimerase
MVTGAGGSIGSELCRQIVNRQPVRIVLYDISEGALHAIQQELIRRIELSKCDTEVIAVLGSVTDLDLLREVLQKHSVSSVFHAAAYKHVHMVENNPLAGARNNILGTKYVLDAAKWANCKTLVVISTDKAVRPTGFMGATKRFAELLVQCDDGAPSSLKTCVVRFGNVLNSSGSVVPIFQSAIERGGPLDVHHADITRYFMSIPEAAELVLQAGAMADSGEVFVLNMGEQIRILDLARRMIELSGRTVRDELHPSGDIEIEISELRPGEKMREELVDGELVETSHQMIRLAKELSPSPEEYRVAIEQFQLAIDNADLESVVAAIGRLVPGYSPSWAAEVTPEISTPISASPTVDSAVDLGIKMA